MPIKEVFVQPALFMSYKGHNVYHCYKNNNANDVVSELCFTTQHKKDDIDFVFDIRHLHGYDAIIESQQPLHLAPRDSEQTFAEKMKRYDTWRNDIYPGLVKKLIRQNIDNGHIDFPTS